MAVYTPLFTPSGSVASSRKREQDDANYFFVNHMRVHNNAEYVKFETEVWRPIAEEWIKEGSQKGWRFNTLLLPSGTEACPASISFSGRHF